MQHRLHEVLCYCNEHTALFAVSFSGLGFLGFFFELTSIWTGLDFASLSHID